MTTTTTPTTTSNGAHAALSSAQRMAEEAAASVHDITNRSIERAREMSSVLRDRAYNAGSHTVGYVREQPFKSVLVAVAVGAAIAVLVRAFSSPSRRH